MHLKNLGRLIGLFLLGVSTAMAQASDGKRLFNIPSQSTEKALTQFGVATGLQVLFVAKVTAELTSPAVKGELTERQALDRLLTDSGLKYEFINKRTVRISASVTDSRAESINAASLRLAQAPAVQSDAASAQTVPPASSPAGQESADLEVVSTKLDGLIQRSIFQATEEGSLPYNVIDREEIARSGATTLDELFRRNLLEMSSYGMGTQSQVGNIGVGRLGASGYVENAVNLRSMGTDQTVILVNGRRLSGSAGGGADISRIPLSSIERIEILSAAAAAIYGGGAGAGAIDIILRRDYAANDLTTKFGTSTQGGGTDYGVNYMRGFNLNEGRTRASVTLDYSKREGLFLGDRDFLQEGLDAYGPGSGVMWRSSATATPVPYFLAQLMPLLAGSPGTVTTNSAAGLGIPGNPTARYAAIPAGLTAAQANALTQASFTGTANTGNFNHGFRAGEAPLVTPSTSYNIQGQIEHDLLPDGRLSMYVEAFVGRERNTYSNPFYLGASLDATHPFNPFDVAVNVWMNTPDLPSADTTQNREDARLTVGFKGSINERWSWTADVSGQHSKFDTLSRNPDWILNYINISGATLTALGYTGHQSDAARYAAYNLFQDHGANPLTGAGLAPFDYYELWDYKNRNGQATFRTAGELWNLPAGRLRVSPGADIRVDHLDTDLSNVSSAEARSLLGSLINPVAVIQQRSVTNKAAWIEATIPVISPKWRPLPLDSLEFGMSRRWDDSNRVFHSAVSDTAHMRLGIVKDVMFRASTTDGFTNNRNAATTAVTETLTPFVTNIRDQYRGDVSVATTVPTYIRGLNPDLRYETFRSLNFGMMLRPRFIPGLTIDVNHTISERNDTVASVSVTNLIQFPDDYPGRIVRAPLTDADRALGYTRGAITFLDVRNINLARREDRSVNYRVNYAIPVPANMGSLDFSVSAINNRAVISQARPTSEVIDRVNAQGQPLSLRGNSSIFWERNGLMVGLTIDYYSSHHGEYTTPSPAFPNVINVLDGDMIPHQMFGTLQLGLKTPRGSAPGGLSWLEGTDLRMTIENVTDKRPAWVSDGDSFYSRYINPRGRFIAVNLKKNF